MLEQAQSIRNIFPQSPLQIAEAFVRPSDMGLPRERRAYVGLYGAQFALGYAHSVDGTEYFIFAPPVLRGSRFAELLTAVTNRSGGKFDEIDIDGTVADWSMPQHAHESRYYKDLLRNHALSRRIKKPFGEFMRFLHSWSNEIQDKRFNLPQLLTYINFVDMDTFPSAYVERVKSRFLRGNSDHFGDFNDLVVENISKFADSILKKELKEVKLSKTYDYTPYINAFNRLPKLNRVQLFDQFFANLPQQEREMMISNHLIQSKYQILIDPKGKQVWLPSPWSDERGYTHEHRNPKDFLDRMVHGIDNLSFEFSTNQSGQCLVIIKDARESAAFIALLQHGAKYNLDSVTYRYGSKVLPHELPNQDASGRIPIAIWKKEKWLGGLIRVRRFLNNREVEEVFGKPTPKVDSIPLAIAVFEPDVIGGVPKQMRLRFRGEKQEIQEAQIGVVYLMKETQRRMLRANGVVSTIENYARRTH